MALVLATPALASAQELVIARTGANDALEAAPVQARVGERVVLRLAMRDRRGRLRPAPSGSVRWFRIVPHMQHEDTQAPNDRTPQYSNSVLFGPRHGQWLGYDQVEYETSALAEGDELVVRRVPPSTPDGRVRFAGAGSFWVSATLTESDGTVLETPGIDSRDHLGLSPSVMRVSFRQSDDFLGWLGTYFHVPDIFGSTGVQADRYVGADCADVLVGAMRASGSRARYTSVQGIASVARPISEVLILSAEGNVRTEGGEDVSLVWGDGVAAGDLMAIDYTTAGAQLPRPWDHIGALLGDGDGDGVLSGGDGLRHMTPGGLVDRPLREEGEIRFRVWRRR